MIQISIADRSTPRTWHPKIAGVRVSQLKHGYAKSELLFLKTHPIIMTSAAGAAYLVTRLQQLPTSNL